MTDRIVSFRGGPAPAARIPRQDVIDMLEAALDKARAGELQAAVLVMMDADQSASHDIQGLLGGWSLVGSMRLADHHLVNMTIEANDL